MNRPRRRRRRRSLPHEPFARAEEMAKRRFGVDELRPQQADALRGLLDGEDVVAVLPTGYGKSLLYQMAALLNDAPTVVVSPLIALMADQQRSMRAANIPVIRLDSSLRAAERREALARLEEGGSLVVLTTPETLGSKTLGPLIAEAEPSLLCVDEAHCVSEWGHDFRPAYLRLGLRRKVLGMPQTLALTATATPKVREDIAERLLMEEPVIVAAPPHRENLRLGAARVPGGAKPTAAGRLLATLPRPGVVYCATTVEVDRLFTALGKAGLPVDHYHGRMRKEDRELNAKRFLKPGRPRIMVATSAFGMGIDKPDIRFVVHYQAPGSLEQYVQEAGRGGRDGDPCDCILLFDPEDLEVQRRLRSRSRPRADQLRRLARALAAWSKDGRRVSVEDLALSAEVPATAARALTARLEEVDVVEEDADKLLGVVGTDEEMLAEADGLARRLDVERMQDDKRIDALRVYVEEEEDCRSIFLRKWFGEEDPPRCGHCDLCRGEPAVPSDVEGLKGRSSRLRKKGGRSSGKGRSPSRSKSESKNGSRSGARGGKKRSAKKSDPSDDQGEKSSASGDAPAQGSGDGEGAPKKKRRRRRRRRGRGKPGGGESGGSEGGEGGSPSSGGSDEG